MKLLLSTALALLATVICHAGEEVIVDSQGMKCHLYTPAEIDPNKTYQLLVGVHGAGGQGNGAAGLKGWTARGDVIVIGPSFQTKGARPYQNGDGPHADKLIKLFKELGETYNLREQMFLHGFSGGSQFAHRFAMNHPKYVCGVSAHSGGSWATDGFGRVNTAARKIPFAISCGEKDTAMSFGGAKFNRLDWYRRFQEEIDRKGFCHIGATWPDTGHRMGPGAWDFMRQCFQLSTGLPGKSATEKVAISDQWKNLDRLPEVEEPEDSGSDRSGVPYVNPATLAKVTTAAFAKAEKETISDDKLVNFMERYPPILWKDQEGATKLLEQCEGAAQRWKEAATKAGRFNGAVQQRFERFSKGLKAAEVATTP
jgi:predicted esterase